MKTIRCNLTKACRIFATFTEFYIKIWSYFLKNFKKFYLFIDDLYARLYQWYIFEAEGLLVY